MKNNHRIRVSYASSIYYLYQLNDQLSLELIAFIISTLYIVKQDNINKLTVNKQTSRKENSKYLC